MAAKNSKDVKDPEVVAEEAEIEEVEDTAEQLPLALGINGDPIDVPDDAVGWRVSWRKLGERGGSPTLIYANGRPLILPLDATADDLIEHVGGKPGRFRLEPVDETGRVIKDATPAYSVIEKQIQIQPAMTPAPVDSQRSPSMEGVVHELIQGNRAAIKTLQDCFTVQSQQVASMLNACSNMVNPNRPVQQILTVEKEGNAGFDWATFMATVTPAVQTLMGVLMQRFSGAGGAATPPVMPAGPR